MRKEEMRRYEEPAERYFEGEKVGLL